MREIHKRYLSPNFLTSKFFTSRKIPDKEELVFDKEREILFLKKREILSREKKEGFSKPPSINQEDLHDEKVCNPDCTNLFLSLSVFLLS